MKREDYRAILMQNPFFMGMDEGEIDAALDAMRSSVRSFGKEEVILHAGDVTANMGIVLSGSVRIESIDMWGNRTILSHIGPGEVFAETYAYIPGETLLVDAVSNEDSSILMLRLDALHKAGSDLAWRRKILDNLLAISLRKNLLLSGRIFNTSPKSLRGRVMSYLSSVSLQTGSPEFEIPFDRQQMADYLSVERTALSKELGRMRSEGIIEFRKNHFKLIK